MRTFYGVLVYIFHPNTARIVLDFIFRVHDGVKSNESQSLFWIIMAPNPKTRKSDFSKKKAENEKKIRVLGFGFGICVGVNILYQIHLFDRNREYFVKIRDKY